MRSDIYVSLHWLMRSSGWSSRTHLCVPPRTTSRRWTVSLEQLEDRMLPSSVQPEPPHVDSPANIPIEITSHTVFQDRSPHQRVHSSPRELPERRPSPEISPHRSWQSHVGRHRVGVAAPDSGKNRNG